MAENFITEAFALLAIALVAIGLRLYIRILTVGFRKLALDDYLMIWAGCLYSAETVLAYAVGVFFHGLANSGMTPEQRAELYMHRYSGGAKEEYRLRTKGSQNQLAGWLTYTTLLWTLKACMLTFYSRLTDNVTNMRLRIRIGAVMLLVTYLATVLTIIFSCYPLHRHWQIYPDPGNACQTAIATIEVAVLLAMNISTDLYLMSVPLPMIWKSRLAMKKKWVLSIMFSGGILIIVAGILRCVLILTAGANGPALAGEWSIRESFIAVMVNNLPMLYTLYQRIAQSDLFSQSRNLSGKSSGRGSYPLGSYRTGESGKASKKGKKFQHPLSMPNDTAMGSDERIVVNPNNPHATGGYEPPVGEKPAQLGPYTTNAEDERNKAGSRGITVQTELSVHSTNEGQAPVGNGHSYSHFPPPV